MSTQHFLRAPVSLSETYLNRSLTRNLRENFQKLVKLTEIVQDKHRNTRVYYHCSCSFACQLLDRILLYQIHQKPCCIQDSKQVHIRLIVLLNAYRIRSDFVGRNLAFFDLAKVRVYLEKVMIRRDLKLVIWSHFVIGCPIRLDSYWLRGSVRAPSR